MPENAAEFPELFPHGTFVVIVSNGLPPQAGTYQGNGGKRWYGIKHRVKLSDGRSRYVSASKLVRPGRWEPAGGLLHRWTPVQRMEDLQHGSRPNAYI